MRRVLGTAILALAIQGLGLSSGWAAQHSGAAYDGPSQAIDPSDAVRGRMYKPGDGLAKAVQAIQAKRYDRAVHILGPITDEAPGNLVAWRLLGSAYAGEGKWDASRRAYRHALWLAPEDIVSHAGMAVALSALKDPRAEVHARWFKARIEACRDTCPEADLLKTLQARGPFANGTSS